MKEVLKIIEAAQADFREQLQFAIETGGLTKDRYQRFLSMQYHLTNGVQKHFFALAAHPEMVNRKSLRKFLINFADEEETHYLIAKKDLENLGLDVLPVCLDVKIWWSYFNGVINDHPFARLGATCILENISLGNADLIQQLIVKSDFLNPRNTRFIVIHQHNELPHGDQINEAIGSTSLTPQEMADLVEGAGIGRTMYLRLFSWVLHGSEMIAKPANRKAA